MPYTETFEPIRPLHGEWKTTESYKMLFGEGCRVFYGWSGWPSHSYSSFGNESEYGLPKPPLIF